jgi:hypothetical protein
MNTFVWGNWMSRYKPPTTFAEFFSFLEWFLVRAFLVIVLALELWERIRHLIHHLL